MSRLMLTAALFAFALCLATVPKARKLESPDFKVFYTAARHAVETPGDMYKKSPDRYLYPPSTAPLLVPFAFSENYPFHQWTWHAFLGILLFLLARVSWAALAAMALLTRYLAVTFGYGQINLLVMASLAAAGVNLGKNALSGSLFVFATSLKVYPAVLFPAYLRRFSWGSALGMAGTALALFLFPLLLFGWAPGWELYRDFFLALADKGLPVYSHNQSFSALLLRLFSDQSFLLHGVGETKWTLAALAPGAVRSFALLLGASLSGFTWWKAWRRNEVDSFLSAAAFSVLFLSHIVWKDYLLLLYFPLRELFSRLEKRPAWTLAGVILAIVTFSSPDVLGAGAASRLDAACIHLGLAILVWGTWWKRSSR